MSARRFHASAIWSAAILLVSIVGIGAVAVHLGADGSGDTRNYHYYGGYALLNKPVGFDLAPAQLQTYIHPGVDTLFYGLSRLLNHFPRMFTFVWAIPQALAV